VDSLCVGAAQRWGDPKFMYVNPTHQPELTCSTFTPTVESTDTPVPALCKVHEVGVHGHLNWGFATYTGKIYWEEYDNGPFQDNDFNMVLKTGDDAGVTIHGDQIRGRGQTLPNGQPDPNIGTRGIGIEFSAIETMSFGNPGVPELLTPSWATLAGGSDLQRGALIDGKDAIVTGLVGMDMAHDTKTEIHPTLAMAIKIKSPVWGDAEEAWLILARRNGDEGECSHSNLRYLHALDGQNIIFLLDSSYASPQVDTAKTTFYHFRSQYPYSAGILNGGKIILTLSNPQEGAVMGEIHFFNAALPNPSGSSLTSFSDNTGEHLFYLDADRHVNQLYFSGKWTNQDLTAVTGSGSALPAAGSSLTSFTDNTGEHLFYLDANQHVDQMYWSHKWINQDITSLSNSSSVLPAQGSSLTSFADNTGEHVFYLDRAQHVRQLYWSGGWINQDLTSLSNDASALPAAGTSLTSFSDNTGEHVFYLDPSQHVRQLYWSGKWVNQDLTSLSNGASALPAAGSALTSFSDKTGEHVFYLDANQHVIQLYWSDKWTNQDLTLLSNSASVLPAVGSSLTSFSDKTGEHVFYRDANQHIRQLYWSGNWTNQDLTSLGSSGSALSATGSPFTSFADKAGEHLLYLDANQHFRQLYWSGKWTNQDLLALSLQTSSRNNVCRSPAKCAGTTDLNGVCSGRCSTSPQPRKKAIAK
jgi:hypothetical protein